MVEIEIRFRNNILDTLFEALERGEIDMEGIAEEVDTFTFEGHDTSTVAISWALQEWSILLIRTSVNAHIFYINIFLD